MRTLRRCSLLLSMSAVMIAACGPEPDETGPAGSAPALAEPVTTGKVVGEHGGPCAPVQLQNDPDNDQQLLAVGTTCFLTEYDAGRPIIWDVIMPTMEGDPIFVRYDYDGTTIAITTDSRADQFGSGEVIEQLCGKVVPTAWFPEGADCTSSPGEGFQQVSND